MNYAKCIFSLRAGLWTLQNVDSSLPDLRLEVGPDEDFFDFELDFLVLYASSHSSKYLIV